MYNGTEEGSDRKRAIDKDTGLTRMLSVKQKLQRKAVQGQIEMPGSLSCFILSMPEIHPKISVSPS